MAKCTYWMVLTSLATLLSVGYGAGVQMTIEPPVLKSNFSNTPIVVMNCSVLSNSSDSTILFLEMKRKAAKEKDGNYVVIASMTAGQEAKLNGDILDVTSRKPEVHGARHSGTGGSPPHGYLTLTWDLTSLDCLDAGTYECNVGVLDDDQKKNRTNSISFPVKEKCGQSTTADSGDDAGLGAGIVIVVVVVVGLALIAAGLAAGVVFVCRKKTRGETSDC